MGCVGLQGQVKQPSFGRFRCGTPDEVVFGVPCVTSHVPFGRFRCRPALSHPLR